MDLYDLLGLARGATLLEIKRSYRRLARKYHPDINPGDHAAEARFKDITRAYETLSDPDLRLRYDAAGAVAEATAAVTVEFEGFDFSAGGGHASVPTFGDLFAEVFTQRQETRSILGPEPGADLHATISLTFDEGIRGAHRQVAVTRREACKSCRGAGTLNAAESKCQRCQGAGVIKSRRGHMVFSKTCDACEGAGRLARTTCMACAGLGVESRAESIAIHIPAGVSDGARIRIPEKGHAGFRGGRIGDLYIAVQVEASDLFRREGDDFHIVVPIAVHEAALGAKVDVPAPDGHARLRVPPGTQSGQRFRVRGRGAPSPRDGERGDLVVEVKIVLPRLLDERSKELLREFGRINAEDVRK
ncbi:MAG TPA: molecular chaperone DnaJ [Vicinamibacterales bacterium]|jgi:molecular chaperone DnaJ|nr:molecular chaperone DnaJ [Vicinamibacterales bacterium]